MKKQEWSGRWPTDEYPPQGTRIRWQDHRGAVHEGVISFVWCGVEPVFDVSGRSVHPSLDPFEVL